MPIRVHLRASVGPIALRSVQLQSVNMSETGGLSFLSRLMEVSGKFQLLLETLGLV